MIQFNNDLFDSVSRPYKIHNLVEDFLVSICEGRRTGRLGLEIVISRWTLTSRRLSLSMKLEI